MIDSNRKDEGDWLGYGVYADTLWARIERALAIDLIDGELGDDPMVIGIFGEWGAGKSQLLKLIERRAKASLMEQKSNHESDPGFELTVPVWFQPWKYEHEEHLHVPMVIHVLNALKDALKQEATVVDTVVNTSVALVDSGTKAAPVVQKTLEVASSVYPVIQKILKSITVFGCNVDLPDDVGEWLETAADGVSDIDLKNETKVKISTVDAAVKHTNDGSYFYRIHELLGALTRPHGYKHRKDLFKDAKLTLNTRINFVIFIDDLDRCLPEKAVQTLELIKTMFNVESFAFVLALDDEVIERGIGHRYQAYNFAGKKPEMPITGFEYLEKIVHLPFRLPALTHTQARNFILRLEKKIAPDEVSWFEEYKLPATPGEKLREKLRQAANPSKKSIHLEVKFIDLLGLTLDAFDAYVPRKLTRLVELWHSTVEVAKKRHQNDPRKELITFKSNSHFDVRIAFSLLMVQLFHPDLYRVFRRHEETFSTFFSAFDVKAPPENQLSASTSDIDLWHWATYRANQEIKPTGLKIALDHISKLGDDQRFSAQQKRLPLVERLIEHRAAQRHVFDALKLFAALKKQMPDPLTKFDIRKYFSLLSEFDELLSPISELVGAQVTQTSNVNPAATSKTFTTDSNRLYTSVISADSAMQESMTKLPEFVVGQYLLFEQAEATRQLVSGWLLEGEHDGSRARREKQLLAGLTYLARFLAPPQHQAWWSLIKMKVDANDTKTHLEPKLRAQWHDVRAALGQDIRFEGKYALPKRIPGDAIEAPAGFVLCMPIEYIFGYEYKTRIQTKPFYVSRYAVTVAQYSAFVAADGYKDQGLWESAHKDAWLWKIGRFDELKNITAHSYEKPLSLRPTNLRHLPMDWEEQLTHRNRPVTGITWFEATVFAAWLENQREVRDGGSNLWGTLNEPQYRLRLPTEGEWERAARAGGRGTFPWGDDVTNIDQFANVGGSVRQPSTVGSYSPNALGLYDMAGNVWQWQANLYTNPYENRLVLPRTTLEIHPQTVEAPALRGGSWREPHESSQSSDRDWNHPGIWSDNIGFRLVLSLIDSEA